MPRSIHAPLHSCAVMRTNFFGAMAVTAAALPVLRAQRSGAIVNVSSMIGQMSFPGTGAYSASKFVLEGASEALAQAMAPFGVKVPIVEPGAFRTDFAGPALRHMPPIDADADTVGPDKLLAGLAAWESVALATAHATEIV